MISKYRYGNPIKTEAVTTEIITSNEQIPYFILHEEDEQITMSYQMESKDAVYGLGESIRGINKRGFRYKSLCSDDPVHTEEKESLYGAHNFILVDGREIFGLFVDQPGEVVFDIGFSDLNILEITICSSDADIYIIQGDSALSIIHEFRELIGTSYIPPRWGMGFGQSRWSYPDEATVTEVVNQYRHNDIPLDSVYLDIDYMDHYKDFTLSNHQFPDFPQFVKKMSEEGIHLVPIIDAGVKIEKGYAVYEEGVEKGYFCKKEDGSDYVAGVWPGRVHFPDVLNKKARKWFGMQYKTLLDQGIDGFWNDMNEPAIFYSEERLQSVLQELKTIQKTDMPLDEFWHFTGLIKNLQNNVEDYKTFYHDMDGIRIRHDKVHNIYGYNMTRAASDAFTEIIPDKRILIFSRSSYVGMHRYGGIWTGDNQSWWSHILQSMKQMTGLNMCGFLYVGSDIGGFGSNASEDLVMRFTEWGIFTPLMRNHSALGTRRQEAYMFENVQDFANIIDLRYFLLPYIYSEYMRAALKNEMYFYPLAFLYPEDKRAAQVEDQLFIGKGMMIAPVYTQNADGRYVYLPEPMKLYRFRSRNDFDTELLSEGDHYIPCECNEVLVFVRPGYIIPCAYNKQLVKNVDDVSYDQFILLSNAPEHAKYNLYIDDGYCTEYNMEKALNTIYISETGDVTIMDGQNNMTDREVVSIY